MEKQKNQNNYDGAVATGTVIILLGLVWLLRRLDVAIPYWVSSWQMLLIGIGLLLGIGNRFRNTASYVLIGIGSFFLLTDYMSYPAREFIWPVAIILVGLIIVLKSLWQKKRVQRYDDQNPAPASGSARLNITSIFNGIKRTINSKDFRGGSIVNIFGGSDINLLQSDMQGTAVLDVTVIFGGVKLLVPPTWEVRLEETSLFGGVDDKRHSSLDVVPEDKVLVITGTVMFGGIDIQSL